MFPSVIKLSQKIKYIDESNHYNNTSFFDGIVAKLFKIRQAIVVKIFIRKTVFMATAVTI